MRSALADPRILPVENLAFAPSFARVTPGTTVVRRNICLSPRGVAALPFYDLAGNQTITANEAVSDHPLGITTANRVTYASGVLNPGVTLGAGLVNGSIWSVSAWVKVLSDDPATRYGLALNGQVSETARDLAVGTWVYISWAMPAVSTVTPRTVGFRASGTVPSAGAFLITGISVENRPAPLPSFDGATVDTSSLLYAWEGATNASASTAAASTVEIARNLWVDPKCTSASTVGLSSNNGTRSLVTDMPGTINTGIRWTCDTAGASRALMFKTGTTTPELGAPIIFRATLRSSVNRTITFSVRPDTSLTTNAVTIGSVDLVANVAQTVAFSSASFLVAAGANSGITVVSGTAAVGDLLDITTIVIMAGPAPTGLGNVFFDGERTPDADLTPLWLGAVNASASVLVGTILANTGSANSSTSLAAVIRSWVYGGSRVIALSTATDTANLAAGSGSSLSGRGVTFKPGLTYTILARSRILAPMVSVQSRTHRLYFADSVRGYSASDMSPVPTNVAGVYNHRIVVTVPIGATWATVRLYCGVVAGNGDVYWDKFLIVEGEYYGQPFDGDSPNSIWRGTPHNSSSIGYQAF